MAEAQQSEVTIPQITTSSTKQEMLAAYKDVVKRLKEKRETELKPQARVEERAKEEALQVADSLSTEGIGREVGNLKSEIGKVLVDLSDKMEEEIGKYLRVRRAVETKATELKEVCDIEKEALSLAALIEAQRERRERFDTEMTEKKETLESDIASTREGWKEEQEMHKAEVQSRDSAEKQKREREAEEWKYGYEREKRLAQEQFEYEKAKMDRDTQLRREELERDLTAREKALSEQETELSQLREKVALYPAELAAALEKAVNETTERLSSEGKAREALMQKESEGEHNVLNSRIEALQQTVKELQQQNAKLAGQIEKSYGQVQDIAVKAIEGSANVKVLSALQSQSGEKPRGSGQGES